MVSPYLCAASKSSGSADKLCDFRPRELPPLPYRQSSEFDVHESDALERAYPISEDRAHASNLSIQALGQRDGEYFRIEPLSPARRSDSSQNAHTSSHP